MTIIIIISIVASLIIGAAVGATVKSRQMNSLMSEREAEKESVYVKLAEKNSSLEKQLSAASNQIKKLTDQLKNNKPDRQINKPQAVTSKPVSKPVDSKTEVPPKDIQSSLKVNREYIVFDLECTCWPDNTGKIQETTEIGAVRIKNNRKIGEYHSYVRPVVNPQLSKFCTELTKVTQEQVDNAPLFADAYEDFRKWCLFGAQTDIAPTKELDYWLLSWGHFDRHKLAEQAESCGKSDTDIEWLRRHTSLKHECARIFKMPQPGFGRILGKLGLRFEGDRHTALDDAKNISAAFLKMTTSTSAIKNDFKFNPQKTIKKIKKDTKC